MSELQDLYQDLIVDHSKKPRNFGNLEGANRQATGYNPLCGDKVTVYLKVANGVVQDVRFDGAGCAISTASASLMTERFKGLSEAEAASLFETFHKLVTGKQLQQEEVAQLGKLSAFSGVKDFPIRVKCASLAWHTSRAALEGTGETITSE
ncbi:MAG: SUF system NifU family Fe-S cluster assembly protein [Acidobacteria bacterium RIFCSPLOWO2_02_FULL_59_13]|nr:MAG: SUF system NifU family Fe-S cluster assembly protein [Acidobacteria bacterium RIFCSPLOWO2_02_FULL_59_13]